MKNILITGGAGFVGSHLAERLLKEGWNIAIIDNLSSGKLDNLKKIEKQFKFINLDIRDLDELKKLNLKADVIVHLAAQIYVEQSVLNPQETFDINSKGTQNMLEFAKQRGIKKFIFASSSAVYGNVNKENISEEEALNPISPYGKSKLMAEEELALFNKLYEMTTTSLRFFNIYGLRQNINSPYTGVITKFFETIKNGDKPIIYGDGKQTRDFIYVEDVVEGIIKSINLNDKKNHIYNVGTGKTVSINNLLDLIKTLSGKRGKISPLHKPKREGDILLSGADIAKIKKELGFMPKYTIKQGLSVFFKK